MPTGRHPLPSPLSQALGRRIGDAISTHGASQRRVAEDAGMSAAQLSRVVTGKKVFTIDQLDAVCSTLNLDLVDVVRQAEIATLRRTDHDLVANDTINEFPDGDDADFDQA